MFFCCLLAITYYTHIHVFNLFFIHIYEENEILPHYIVCVRQPLLVESCYWQFAKLVFSWLTLQANVRYSLYWIFTSCLGMLHKKTIFLIKRSWTIIQQFYYKKHKSTRNNDLCNIKKVNYIFCLNGFFFLVAQIFWNKFDVDKDNMFIL